MRSRLAWLLAGFGIAAALAARLRTKEPRRLPAAPEPDVDPRADELRRRIAESREVVGEREEFEAAETPVDEADPGQRRREVHQRGRAAVERMRGDASD